MNSWQMVIGMEEKKFDNARTIILTHFIQIKQIFDVIR